MTTEEADKITEEFLSGIFVIEADKVYENIEGYQGFAMSEETFVRVVKKLLLNGG